MRRPLFTPWQSALGLTLVSGLVIAACASREFNAEDGADAQKQAGQPKAQGLSNKSLKIKTNLDAPKNCSVTEKTLWVELATKRLTEEACLGARKAIQGNFKDPCASSQASCPASVVFNGDTKSIDIDTNAAGSSTKVDADSEISTTDQLTAEVGVTFNYNGGGRIETCKNPIEHPNAAGVFKPLAESAWKESCEGGKPADQGTDSAMDLDVELPKCPTTKTALTKRAWAVQVVTLSKNLACNAVGSKRQSKCSKLVGTTCESEVKFTYKGVNLTGQASGGISTNTSKAKDSTTTTTTHKASLRLSVSIPLGPTKDVTCINPADLSNFAVDEALVQEFDKVCK